MRGWADPLTLALLLRGVLLLALFVTVEFKTRSPRCRCEHSCTARGGSAFLTNFLMQMATFGFYLFMSYYTQAILGYSPMQAGLTMIVTAIAATAGSLLIAGKLLEILHGYTVVLMALPSFRTVDPGRERLWCLSRED